MPLTGFDILMIALAVWFAVWLMTKTSTVRKPRGFSPCG